jgi:predicted ABC-type ATPase
MPVLTVFAGPNGSGKSTITSRRNFEGKQNLLDPDAVAKRLNPLNPSAARGLGSQRGHRANENLSRKQRKLRR